MTQYAQESALNAAGRFGRFSYLAWNFLLAIVASIILGIFIAIFPNTFVNLETGNFGGGMIFIILIYVALMYFTFVFTIRRLHDRNHTGWLSLLMLVPLANVILMLYLIFAPGDDRSNSYGSPRPTAGWEAVLAWIYILIFVLAIIGGIAAGFMS
ncbi:DUF805 domain-containing protein [Acinetobacter johnsonii]|uniref:DUF805 domain-containing protein n=1 Tax=Acinetobacter johnsonii TaxID=40214 RepID=UPI00244BE437|nr:DUF805 domain-containing protein [Acinetobacter johnsonii]MDH1799270.1 DUF805 domain-containing protein [Acinetobacter johnsonii]